MLPNERLVLLADGITGRKGAAVASQLAIQAVHAHIRQREWAEQPRCDGSVEQTESWLRAAFGVADRLLRVQQVEGIGGRRHAQGVTTLLALAFVAGEAVVAHVGDSRCYRLRARRLEQLTKDHTLLALSRPHVTAEELEYLRPLQELALSRSLGGAPPEVDSMHAPLEARDVYLVCSNGLVEGLGDTQIQRILLAWRDDPRRASERLVEAARRAGAIDDITAVVVAVSESGKTVSVDPASFERPHDTPWTSGPTEFAAA